MIFEDMFWGQNIESLYRKQVYRIHLIDFLIRLSLLSTSN
jgi:hypothetical protein